MTYSKIGGGPHSGWKIFNGSRPDGVIDGLLPFTVYSLNVSASTVKGQGPASPAITVKTEEEGRWLLMSLLRDRVRNESQTLYLYLSPLAVTALKCYAIRFFVLYRKCISFVGFVRLGC